MLDLEYQTGVIVVRIRVAPRETLTFDLLDGLDAAIAYIGSDRPVILTGAGSVFAPDLDPVEGPARTEALIHLPRVLMALGTHPSPVVAAINGDAIGAGYTLARAADIRIMSGGIIQPSSRRAVRYPAWAAAAAGLVEHRCAPADLIGVALRQVSHIHAVYRPGLVGREVPGAALRTDTVERLAEVGFDPDMPERPEGWWNP